MNFTLAWCLSWPLRIVSLGRVADGREPWVSKRQHRWTPLLVAVTEALFRVRFRTLTGPAWFAREGQSYARLYGLSVRAVGSTLRLPRLPGRVAHAVLQDPTALDAHLDVVRACVHGLYRAHHAGDGDFSHGDATVRNFLYEPATHIARLFDFETEHDHRRPVVWRRADDLRALSGSAAACLGPDRYPDLMRVVALTYPDVAVRAECLALWQHLLTRPDPFHLAQTRLDAPGHRALIAAWE